MPYAQNALDGTSVYFEDDGGAGAPVVLYGGILDSVESVRASRLARALQELTGEFRLVYADHRGLGRSDQHRETEAYAMPLQAADFVAVLGALGVEKAHLVGRSYGGRLGFGVGEHAAEHVLSLGRRIRCGGVRAMVASGDISTRLHEWRMPCLVYLGASDGDFLAQARRAADEIPDAEFVGLDELDHLAAHYEADRIVPAVRTLRAEIAL